jgi:phosphoserine phosphatase
MSDVDDVDALLAAVERRDYERRRAETLRMVEFIEATAVQFEADAEQWRAHARELRERWEL